MSKKYPSYSNIFIVGNPVTSISGVNGNPNPLSLPGSGTTVFPLPGSFPWAAGARGKFYTLLQKSIFCQKIHLDQNVTFLVLF